MNERKRNWLHVWRMHCYHYWMSLYVVELVKFLVMEFLDSFHIDICLTRLSLEGEQIGKIKNLCLLQISDTKKLNQLWYVMYTLHSVLNAYNTRTIEYLTDIIAIRLESIGFKWPEQKKKHTVQNILTQHEFNLTKKTVRTTESAKYILHGCACVYCVVLV